VAAVAAILVVVADTSDLASLLNRRRLN